MPPAYVNEPVLTIKECMPGWALGRWGKRCWIRTKKCWGEFPEHPPQLSALKPLAVSWPALRAKPGKEGNFTEWMNVGFFLI